jgi:hypothetical protein
MVDHEEWRFGDEASGTVCAVCGKANRAGQVHCAYCGTRLDATADEDPAALRTISEAMVGDRAGRRRRRERPWMWPAALVALTAVVAAGYWWSREPARHLSLEDVIGAPASRVGQPSAAPSPAIAPPRAVDAAVARPPAAPDAAVARPPAAPVQPSPAAIAARPAPRATTVEPPRPPVAAVPPARVVVPIPQARPTALRAVAPPLPATPPPLPAMPPPAVDAGDESAAVAPAERRPAEERPALGTDLVEARRSYRAALDAYNARADAYNEVADEVQRTEGRADPERMTGLRERLERAHDAAERARVNAEALRARMEEVQAKYR